MKMQLRQSVVLLLSLFCAFTVEAVDKSKFRTCDDTGFCRRHRGIINQTKFHIPASSVVKTATGITADIVSLPGSAVEPPLLFDLRFYTNGAARMRITEKNKQTPRWESPDIVQDVLLFSAPYRVIAANDAVAPSAAAAAGQPQQLLLAYGTPGRETNVVAVQFEPFLVVVYVDKVEVMRTNQRNMLHFEQHRTKDAAAAAAAAAVAAGSAETVNNPEGKEIVDYGEDGLAIYADGTQEQRSSSSTAAAADDSGLWEESFQSHKDSKPLGPSSVGLDVLFPAAAHVYGIPEHASSFSLKSTRSSSSAAADYSEPFRLYNLDVFEYELDEPMALYGSIPVLMAPAVAPAPSCGLFWNNPSETFVDVEKGEGGTHTHWMSESGVLDLWLLTGPSPAAVSAQYAGMTGVTGQAQLPPLWALGYHQCRWNYKDEQDVAMVDAGFDEHNIPYDVLWLDIEHTDGKRYFTWDKDLFPAPLAMQEAVAARGRQMVTIVDPHIKRDPSYSVHADATAKGLYVKAPGTDDKDFDGWCWPGSSSYLDFTCPEVRDWWAGQFSYASYEGSSRSLYTWNDMNEPSVFNGPEVSMPKDARSRAGVEHREWHNMYGFYMQWATARGLQQREQQQQQQLRPFVLSRAFSAGSQRFGAIWTGDNTSQWGHLKVATPMLLSVSIAGLPFAGADVGGFFGDPSEELLTRWYQAGAYQPFFRGHAHHDSKRREPWLFGQETTRRIRAVLRQRYALLPYWYTLFADASLSGAPVMRPLWWHYPQESAAFPLDDQWLVGENLLVKPVVDEGGTSVSVYLPGNQPWYDVSTGTSVSRAGPGSMLWRNDPDASQRATVQASLDVVPVFQRGGSIVPRQQRPRRSSSSMRADPYTLTVALDLSNQASGELYLDDFSTLTHLTHKQFARKAFRFSSPSSSAAAAAAAAEVGADGSQQQQQQQQLVGGDVSELRCWSVEDGAGFAAGVGNTVERVVVLGLGSAPTAVTAVDEMGTRELEFSYDKAGAQLTVRQPAVRVAGDWSLRFNF